jgi:HAD superfamily hydrolase (TIGR01662 family)
MSAPIQAILFDVGGTLRHTRPRTAEEKRAYIAQLMERIGDRSDPDAFYRILKSRARAYKLWAQQTERELTEAELWTRWMLPDRPPETVAPLAVELNQLFRESAGHRSIYPETYDVVIELYRRGYRLGLVSNTTSSVEIPAMLKELNILGCFDTILMSAVVGKRKPAPDLLLDATGRMGISPSACAYVGDQLNRDVLAARRAGYAQAVWLIDPRNPTAPGQDISVAQPDRTITNLRELLDLFPPVPPPQPKRRLNASLSTMYAFNFPSLPDFFEFARRTGFEGIELNHKVTPAMLDGIDLSRYPIRSIHEPCPAELTETEMKKRGWLISALDEASRREGVRAVQRSIDLAHQVGARAIIIHAGQACDDREKLEKRLRQWEETGQAGSPEFLAVRDRMQAIRSEHAAAGYAAVRRSILELLEYAAPRKICLGIENRYHYLEHPSPDELEGLLSLAGPDQIGFVYDVGHAVTLDRLGFYPFTEWLERFSSRIVGTHLHDIVHTTDHFAPGLGSADYAAIARFLPAGAFRTCELQTFNTAEQIRAGIDCLVMQGCIQPCD